MSIDKFTYNGKYLMLALDHRGSFKKLMNPEDPDSVTDEEVIKLKNEIIEALKDEFSALLIDETWGLEACHEVCQVKPFLLPLEKSGYSEEAGERITKLEYSVSQIMELGASGVKLLLYFNPNVESAQKQLETARKVMEECKENDLPLFLEIVTYTPGENTSDTPGVSTKVTSGPHTGSERDVVTYTPGVSAKGSPGLHTGSDSLLIIKSVKKFIDVGVVPDVWKLEYPGSLAQSMELTKLVGDVPWILLTGGNDFETFKNYLEGAAKAGAKGFLAGRALWQEVCRMEGEGKQKFLNGTLQERFKTVAEITTKF